MAKREKQAAPRPAPRLYLVTPPIEDAKAFAAPLADALAAGDVAAVLLRLTDADDRTLIKRAKTLCPIVQDNDAALLIDRRADLVARADADGAHLTGIEALNESLTTLKPERIAGCGGLASRHDAMEAVEAGADYAMFGEANENGARPDFAQIEERVGWWADVFELPCVAYAASLDEVAALVAAGADFVALGDWIWREPQRVAALIAAAAQNLSLPETTA